MWSSSAGVGKDLGGVPPVAAGGVGADEGLCVLELLLHIPHQLPTLVALEGAQEQFRPHLYATHDSLKTCTSKFSGDR